MKRSALSVAMLVMLSGGAGHLSAGDVHDFQFPFVPGAWWAYDYKSEHVGPLVYLWEISRTLVPVNGTQCMEMIWYVDGEYEQSGFFTSDSIGVWLHKGTAEWGGPQPSEVLYTSPLLWFVAEMEPGMTYAHEANFGGQGSWLFNGQEFTGTAERSMRWVDDKSVPIAVPAGTFQAREIYLTLDRSYLSEAQETAGYHEESTAWVADGVGLVKLEANYFWDEDPDHVTEQLFQLREYRIPEPSTLALLITGGIGLLACAWRRWKWAS